MTSAVEAAIGRPLRRAEEAIDVARLDQALREAKDELDAAIQSEMLRATLNWIMVGGRPSLNVTDAMLAPLEQLTDLGREEAWNELDRAGYAITRRFEIEGFPEDRDPDDYLRRNLTGIEVRIEQDIVRADLSGASHDAVARALLRVPGGRDIASRIVSTALTNGLAETFEEVGDDVWAWEYTAILDGRGCDRCQPLDGTRYLTLEELFRVLPNFGPNPRCLGGGRCRCRAVPVPADEAPAGTIVNRASEPQPLEQAFQTPRGTAPAPRGVRTAVAEAAKVHGITGQPPTVRIRNVLLPPGNPGQYRFRGADPVDIRVSSTADDPAFSTLHEMGHFISHQSIGTRGEWNASDAPELEAWRNAIAGSNSVRLLIDWMVAPPTIGTWSPAPAYIREYLLDPEELFARSYAQYIAARSLDADVAAELARARRMPYPEQWADDDFQAIAAAFDRLFEELGWRTST